MIRQYDGWDSDHFHSQLRLPMECTIANGIVVTLEGTFHQDPLVDLCMITALEELITHPDNVTTFWMYQPWPENASPLRYPPKIRSN
jgi:hypothetical protein